MIDKYIKEFMEKNITLIDLNAYEELYKRIMEFDPYSKSIITEALLSVNINPLNYMNKIPKGMFTIFPHQNIDEFQNFKEISIPDNITEVENEAFYLCKTLIDITIGNKVTQIGKKAFSNCSWLKKVIITNPNLHIEEEAFSDCGDDLHIYFKGTQQEWKSTHETFLFRNTKALCHCNDGIITENHFFLRI